MSPALYKQFGSVSSKMATPDPARPKVPPRRLRAYTAPQSGLARDSTVLFGGQDYQFAQTVPEKLICNVCTKPLRDPHLTTCCGQHFCEKCLKSWFLKSKKESCPHCRAEGETFQHVIDKKLIREIESLQILCPHKPKGCTWAGEVRSLRQHLESVSGCGYVEIECPNKCKIAKIQRNSIDKHLQSECERRPSRCQFCGHKDVYQAFKEDKGHYSTCSEFEVECPNQCGVTKIKRKDLESHRKECKLECAPCPFEEVGCETKSLSNEMEIHMSTQLQQHLLLVMEAYKEMKGELQKTTQELQQLRLRDAEMKQALVLDLKFVRSCTTKEQTNVALSAIQTRLGEAGINWLKKRDDRIVFRMLNFNQHKTTGKVWHSPPFYYKEGYKMCLAVYPSAMKTSKLSQLTLFLLLIKGEYDGVLKWPIKSSFDLKITILVQQDSASKPQSSPPSIKVKFCPKCTKLDSFYRPAEKEEKREMESLGRYKIQDDVEVVGDSIVLSVKVTMHQHEG